MMTERTDEQTRRDLHGDYEEAIKFLHEAMDEHAMAVNILERAEKHLKDSKSWVTICEGSVANYREMVANKLEAFRTEAE